MKCPHCGGDIKMMMEMPEDETHEEGEMSMADDAKHRRAMVEKAMDDSDADD